MRARITPKTVPYCDEFVKKTGRGGPVYTASGAYDAVYIYAEAVARAKTTDGRCGDQGAGEDRATSASPGRIEFDDSHDVKAGAAA